MFFPAKFVPKNASKLEDTLVALAPPQLHLLFALTFFAPGGLFEYAIFRGHLFVGIVGLLVWLPFLWSLLIRIHNAGRVRFWLSMPIVLVGHLVIGFCFVRAS